MPLVSRTFIKAGMVYFLLALISGLLLEVDQVSIPALLPLFWHMLMLGWITQIIMGVSLWMFPGRRRDESFRQQKWSWLTLFLLNLGLVLRIIAEPMLSYGPSRLWSVLLVISAILQVMAGAAYLAEIWPRVLSKKQQRKRRKRMRSKREDH